MATTYMILNDIRTNFYDTMYSKNKEIPVLEHYFQILNEFENMNFYLKDFQGKKHYKWDEGK